MSLEPLEIAHSVVAAAEIARVVQRHYALGEITGCRLLRRGFNEVYEVTANGGERCVARVSALRARGPANVDYEVAMLQFIQARGGPVAAPRLTREGAASTELSLPEGRRALVLFEYVDGDIPDGPDDLEVTGLGLACLHTAAEGYDGPRSRYQLGMDHLLRKPLRWLLDTPTVDAGLREQFSAIADGLESRFADTSALSTVACHGDCHGGNNFIQRHAERATTTFFDFDDCGPGFLAYELAVLPWGLLGRVPGQPPSPEVLLKWQRFMAGYRSQRAIPEADAAAVPAFIAVRQFWLMGEFASRAHHWGSQAMPTSWLRKQVTLLREWQQLSVPAN